ncbi:SET domain-containing protein [Aaosphaeria arxii CBS 175.79]|uniref:SET domain-containing protein n=1 Tax=Aaosphaeria arxii CBS 175.79 TaxID=1450172 RepID=A0A6A5X8X0_9PLEO|nr:SET domain-containing protein [Aaosphaeria arxii CBS 175.79]KAF2009402.1 SET domain-containing protein [Aaosphaeria arxii CBS 175.79]
MPATMMTMNWLVSLPLLTCAAASFGLDTAVDEQFLFKPLACPSGSISIDGECQLQSTIETELVQVNFTRTLEEASILAKETEDFKWTHWPECFENVNTTSPYCVFSSQEFASGRGIFLITNSKNAERILKKPAMAAPETLSRANLKRDLPFELREVPGKGRGLFATRVIQMGEQIFANTAIVLVDSDSGVLADEERKALIARGVDSLPEAANKDFWALLDHFDEDKGPEGRINTNAFDVTINGDSYYAVIPEVSMINHDCRPNTAYFWDQETLTHYVHATRTIFPGEELSDTYIDVEKPRKERMGRLKRSWGFDCACSTCSAERAFAAESDARISDIKEMVAKLEDWSLESEATPDMAEGLISLYIQERIHVNMATPYRLAATVYASYGNRELAMKYARLAVQHIMLEKGWRHPDLEEMMKMLKEPERTWSWGKRLGLKKSGCGCGHQH